MLVNVSYTDKVKMANGLLRLSEAIAYECRESQVQTPVVAVLLEEEWQPITIFEAWQATVHRVTKECPV